MTDPRPVVVIGGGYAGLAAAVTLADAGMPVRVLEAGPVLGGRARRIDTAERSLDNGQHILLGAYRTLLELIARVRHGAPAYHRLPLRLERPGRLRLRAPPLPAPLHLLVAILGCRGLRLDERLATLAFWQRQRRNGFRAADDLTVASLLEGQPSAAVDLLWHPLCTAALNTGPQDASARVFLEVLQAAFARKRADSDLILPTVDLTDLFPAPAAAYIAARGGRVETGVPVRGIRLDDEGDWRVATIDAEVAASAVIVAVGPHHVSALVAPLLEGATGDARANPETLGAHAQALTSLLTCAAATRYEPIVTTYLFGSGLPELSLPLLQLDGQPGEWLIDRAALGWADGAWAVVTSAAGRLAGEPRSAIAAAVVAQLRRLFPALAGEPETFVITERRATFRCAPGRPIVDACALGAGLFVAGDYTHDRFPATLEAAVDTGVSAARGAIAWCAGHGSVRCRL